jgi:DNA-binding transcriptional LysR family regulator
VEGDLAQGSLVRLSAAETSADRAYQAVWNPRSHRVTLVQAFVEWLHSELSRAEGRLRRGRQLPTQDAA